MNSIEDIQRMVAERVALESAGSSPVDESKNIDSRFINECLHANELGDAQLFIALNKGRRLYNETTGEWMAWQGHHWDIDRSAADALSSIEEVVFHYQQEAHSLVDQIVNEADAGKKEKLKDIQNLLYKRITRLRSVRGSNNCLTFSTRCYERMVIKNEEFDKQPWLLPVANGVVDLKTGDLLPGNPKDLLMNYCPHDWTGIDTKCPIWDRTLLEIMNDDYEMVAFLGRLFGYSITGLVHEHILPVMWGKGRNGKGTIIEIVNHVLGSLAAPIKSEMLMKQQFARNPSAPSPEIMALKGLRIAFASESDEGRQIDVDGCKRLTGGDSLVGRFPHDKYQTTFAPTHKLFLLTNNLPKAPASDYAFWQRVVLIPFQLSYVDDPQKEDERKKDKYLMEKLKQEASGILAWFVRGCLEWQSTGLDVPLLVKGGTADYQRKEDFMADFIDECCLVGEDYIERSSILYDAFAKWYEHNNGKRYVPTHTKFGELMAKKFKRKKKGTNHFIGIKLAEIYDG